MRHRRLILALGACLVLALAGIAHADLSQISHVTLTAHRAGQSSGLRLSLSSADPTAPGAKPVALTRLVITFPTGTRFNLGTPLTRTCVRTNAQLRNEFGPTCPRGSRIGTGAAVENASPVAATIASKVTAYVGPERRIILVLKPTMTAFASQIIVMRVAVSGSRLTFPIPRIVLGKAPGFPGVTAVLVSLTLHVAALGQGGGALISAGTCAAQRFAVGARFTYANHHTLQLQSSSACS